MRQLSPLQILLFSSILLAISGLVAILSQTNSNSLLKPEELNPSISICYTIVVNFRVRYTVVRFHIGIIISAMLLNNFFKLSFLN